MSETESSTKPADPHLFSPWPILLGALVLSLAHLGLTAASATPAGLLLFVRSVTGCLLLLVIGQGPALVLLGRGRGTAPLGLLTWLLTSLGVSLVLAYGLAVLVRAMSPPLTGWHLAGLAVASAVAGLALWPHSGRPRLRLDPGLTWLSLGAGLFVIVGFAVVYRHNLFDGLQRFVIFSEEDRARAMESNFEPEVMRVVFLEGLAEGPANRPRRLLQDSVPLVLKNSGQEPVRSRVALVLSGPLGTRGELWQAPADICHLEEGPGGNERLAQADIPKKIMQIPMDPVVDRFNGLLLAVLEVPPGGTCLRLKVTTNEPLDKTPVEVLDLSAENMGGWSLLDGRMSFVAEGTAECHLSDAQYRAQMRESNAISPQLLLWGYFIQFVAETASGARDPMLGLLFLLLGWLSYLSALVMMGSLAQGETEGRIGAWAGLLMVGPLVSHIHSLVSIDTYSFAFPDSGFTALTLGALCMLLQRERMAFVLLGCLAAFARYPGAYIMAVALMSYLALFKQERPLAKRTLIVSLIAAAAVIGVLLVHFAVTTGLESFFRGVYFEIFPEHFEVTENPEPFWNRGGLFLYKLLAYSGLGLAFWPFVRHRAGALLIIVTLAYTLPLIGVHVAHSHYFPVLSYSAAAAGLGALARRNRRLWIVPAAVAVLAGTALGFSIDW